MSDINHRLKLLRSIMKENNVDAVIIPTADRHQSEYVPACYKDREWISGFTGSAGIAIVTHNHATVWTDSRYYLQAETELANSSFELKKQIVRHEPEHIIWLKNELYENSTIAVNYWNFTPAQIKQLQKYTGSKSIKLIDVDLVSVIWEDRPARPPHKIFQHEEQYHQTSRLKKINDIRFKLKEKKIEAYLITALDEVAYVLNLRGEDVQYNPIFLTYIYLTNTSCHLFIDRDKLPSDIQELLNQEGIEVHPYEELKTHLKSTSDKVYVDPNIVNAKLMEVLEQTQEGPSIVMDMKGVKNDVELSHWNNAMIKDGVALTHAFYWLEQTLNERPVSEAEFSSKIASCRSQQEGYRGESFGAIVGYNGNGAIIHYSPNPTSSAEIHKSGILLCDSGGQYLDGTTDITRTIALSQPTKEQKHHFTLVLKGMIALSRSVFPKNTTGGQLDLLARQYLWHEGLNYGHGTGHGVGYFLNVHEGPQGFANAYTTRGRKPLEPGMVLSNEPGHYIDNEYGIRIENLMSVQEAKYDGFYSFNTMTLFPIDQWMMDETQLDAGEKAWINKYHYEVFQSLSPFVEGEMRNWLERKCKPLN